jgi:hypothetical protein
LEPQQLAQLEGAIALLEAVIGEPDCRPDIPARRQR